LKLKLPCFADSLRDIVKKNLLENSTSKKDMNKYQKISAYYSPFLSRKPDKFADISQ